MRNNILKLALTAALILAITFTFGCSDDSGGGNGNPSLGTVADNLSSSSLGSTSNGNDGGPLKKDKISGFSQKGPFTKGSAITLSELNDRFAQTGRSFEATINDDKGSFEIGIKDIELASPYVVLKANGYYRNEITGEISKVPINLYAIADIREKSNVNVNILTHLEYYRVQKLVEGGKSLKDAKKQAQREILAVFNISGDFKDSEDMSIFGTTDSDAALLAISILLQGELSEGQFTERLADFSVKFRETGTWDNETTKKTIADWASNNKRIEYCEYPAYLEKPGDCWPMPTGDMCRTGTIVPSCSGGTEFHTVLSLTRSNILGWNLSSSVPDFEKYVNNYWNVYYSIGACNAQKSGEIKEAPNGIKIICKNNTWETPTEYELDVGGLGSCSTAGEIKKGNVSDVKYICKNNTWVEAKYLEIKCFESKSCLTFTDARDNQLYRSVKIGTQTWMAENLNYDVPDDDTDVCYDDKSANCDIYGRLYNWETAKKVCPTGWHLPSGDEWQKLVDLAGGDEVAGKKLKATSGWNNNGNGTDDFGFAALPGGNGGYLGVKFSEVGNWGSWWGNYEDSNNYAYNRYIGPYNGSANWDTIDKSQLRSARCLRD